MHLFLYSIFYFLVSTIKRTIHIFVSSCQPKTFQYKTIQHLQLSIFITFQYLYRFVYRYFSIFLALHIRFLIFLFFNFLVLYFRVLYILALYFLVLYLPAIYLSSLLILAFYFFASTLLSLTLCILSSLNILKT